MVNAFDLLNRGNAIGGEELIEPDRRKEHLHSGAHGAVVLDDQDPKGHRRTIGGL